MNKLKQILSAFWRTVKKWSVTVFTPVLKFMKRHKILSGLLLLILVIALVLLVQGGKKKNADRANFNEVTATRQDIASTVTGSAVVEPNAEYSIVPLVTGEILDAPFEEGDIVEKGQTMYNIDSSTVQTSLSSANLAIQKAQQNYNDALSSHNSQTLKISKESADVSLQKAQQSYQDILDNFNDLYIRSSIAGRVSEVYVKNGDTVNVGTKIADVVNDSYMEIRIPFNEADAASITPGMDASLTLVGTGTRLGGTVTAVSNAGESTNGYMRIRYVTIQAANPGALSSGDSATAMINGMACNDVGTFSPIDSVSITAKVGGTISSVDIDAGDQVLENSIVAVVESDNLDSQLSTAQLSVREAQLSQERARLQQIDDSSASTVLNAKLSLDDAVLARDKVLTQLEDYTITAPIAGTVVTKNKKTGEKIEMGTSSSDSNVLAVIYDMSSLCFQLDVDELDVKKITVGQTVEVTADAVEGHAYTGVVENVSVNGTVGTNGVTTYPVKVRLQDVDDNILPGMNIDATITVEKAENVIVIPSTAVNRGDTVYVKGDKTEEGDSAPEGYKTVKVTLGLQNESFVEVKSGLNEGDVVYAELVSSDNTMMFPGMGGNMGGGPGGGGGMGGGPGGGGGMGGGPGGGGGAPGGGGGR